jgi:L-lactate dehydrogenase complex protein LldG
MVGPAMTAGPGRDARSTSDARDEVLARIRRALTGDGSAHPAPPPVVRDYRHASPQPPGSAALVDLFAERVEDYRATVTRCADDEASIGTAVRTVLFAADTHSVVTPEGLPDWVNHDGHVVDHGQLGATDLDAVDAVVTASVVAIAETGTIVLDGSGACGRRAITLVPDLHVCVVHTAQIVGSVPEALTRLDPTRPLTFISGPSATSDIELDRVEGVHGPRTLHVILAGELTLSG